VAFAVALARFTYSHGPRDVDRTSAIPEGQEGQQGLSQDGQGPFVLKEHDGSTVVTGQDFLRLAADGRAELMYAFFDE
jgi:hypothetical protein